MGWNRLALYLLRRLRLLSTARRLAGCRQLPGEGHNMCNVGILAFGSLIDDPGEEIGPLVRRRVRDVETPFPVEFARTSASRGGAPTVIPVEHGGAPVRAVILVLDAAVSPRQATDLLWRRETRNEHGDRHYNPPSTPGPNHVIVKQLENFSGIRTVLYTSIGANLSDRTPEHLADLAIQSARAQAGAAGKDGISYLISLKRQGVQTLLTPTYEAAILQKTGASSLETALEMIKRGSA